MERIVNYDYKTEVKYISDATYNIYYTKEGVFCIIPSEEFQKILIKLYEYKNEINDLTEQNFKLQKELLNLK